MRKRIMLGGLLAVAGLLVVSDAAQAQFGFRSGRGFRGGRGYSVDTPIGSYSRWDGGRGGRGYGYGGYGYGRGYGYGNYPYRSGWSAGYGAPYNDGGYYSPGYYSSPGMSSYSRPGMSSGYVLQEGASPATISSQAFYSGTQAEPNQATIRVIVPDANAEVWFEDNMTKQKGTDRLFVSPSLEEGRSYTYKIKASWEQNGRDVTREKDVEVRPGAQAVVNFSEESGQRRREREVEFRDEDLDRNRDRQDSEIRRERIGGRSETHREHASGNTHMGIVVRAASGELVMKHMEGNEEHSHRLAPDAQILIDGKKSNLEDLKAGMHIEVTTKEGDKKVATKIEAKAEGKRSAQPPQ